MVKFGVLVWFDEVRCIVVKCSVSFCGVVPRRGAVGAVWCVVVWLDGVT